MSSLKLKTPSGGSVSFAATDTGSDYTLTVPAGNSTLLTNATSGTILQVVFGSGNSPQTTSTGGVELTGVTANITPSSISSKILIIARMPIRFIKQGSNAAGWASPKLYRDSTLISPAPAVNHEIGINFGDANWGDFRLTNVIQSLDSPSTTSQITYSSRMTLYDAQSTLQVNEASAFYSTITLMEVAG